MPTTPQYISDRFHTFATLDEVLRSPLYSFICLQIAKDPEPYIPFAEALLVGQPLPNTLLGAMHFLVQTHPDHPLAAYYGSIMDSPKAPDHETYPLFRSFYEEQQPALLDVARTRRTQTNEVRRCVVLLPAYGVASKLAQYLPLSLIEIGCSAGLNLQWDRYGYHYDNGQQAGHLDSPLQIQVALRGDINPPLPDPLPKVAFRRGIDLNPLDVTSEADMSWLKALIWPEQQARVAMLETAIEIARDNPQQLIRGNVLDILPQVTEEIPKDSAPVFYHTFVTYQFSKVMRDQLAALIQEQAAHFEHAFYVSIEWLDIQDGPLLHLTHYLRGEQQTRDLLARCNGHVWWLEWLKP